MARAAPPVRFSRTQVVLHWTVAALVAFQLFFHDAIQDDFDRVMDGTAGASPSAMGLVHIGAGLAILVFALARLWLRLTRGVPEAALPAPKVAIWAGKAAHYALYGFLFLLPVTGLLAFFGQDDGAAALHGLLQWLLLPLILAHAGGALVEHALFRNATLTRMLDLTDGKQAADGKGKS